MERILKFRLVYDGVIDKSDEWHGDMYTDGGIIELPQEEGAILEQFTGLLDKNGKEIYDCDIHMHEFESDGEKQKSYSPIVWDNGAFWVDESLLKDGSLLTLLGEFDEPLNIVGNRFENPELLE